MAETSVHNVASQCQQPPPFRSPAEAPDQPPTSPPSSSRNEAPVLGKSVLLTPSPRTPLCLLLSAKCLHRNQQNSCRGRVDISMETAPSHGHAKPGFPQCKRIVRCGAGAMMPDRGQAQGTGPHFSGTHPREQSLTSRCPSIPSVGQDRRLSSGGKAGLEYTLITLVISTTSNWIVVTVLNASEM